MPNPYFVLGDRVQVMRTGALAYVRSISEVPVRNEALGASELVQVVGVELEDTDGLQIFALLGSDLKLVLRDLRVGDDVRIVVDAAHEIRRKLNLIAGPSVEVLGKVKAVRLPDEVDVDFGKTVGVQTLLSADVVPLVPRPVGPRDWSLIVIPRRTAWEVLMGDD